jgi:hypothetical protein
VGKWAVPGQFTQVKTLMHGGGGGGGDDMILVVITVMTIIIFTPKLFAVSNLSISFPTAQTQ